MLGVDCCSIDNTRQRLQRTPMLAELVGSGDPIEAATRFAIAEAVVKAFDGAITIRNVDISPSHGQRRHVTVNGTQVVTSVTRCGDVVTAVAITPTGPDQTSDRCRRCPTPDVMTEQ